MITQDELAEVVRLQAKCRRLESAVKRDPELLDLFAQMHELQARQAELELRIREHPAQRKLTEIRNQVSAALDVFRRYVSTVYGPTHEAGRYQLVVKQRRVCSWEGFWKHIRERPGIARAVARDADAQELIRQAVERDLNAPFVSSSVVSVEIVE